MRAAAALDPVTRRGSSLADRLWQRIERSPDGCWMWRGMTVRGYGRFSALHTDGQFHIRPAHRLLYELLVEPVPAGLTLDHLCHSRSVGCPGGVACIHRRCVNPAHLEPVSVGENARRGKALRSHCPQGHAYDEANTRVDDRNWRYCRTCARERSRSARAAARLDVAA